MDYVDNSYALEGNLLISSNIETTGYTDGKDGFFKIDYMKMGYVKLDYENGVILGGWTRDEASDDNAPVEERWSCLQNVV